MVKFKGFNNKKESQSSSDRINLLRLQRTILCPQNTQPEPEPEPKPEPEPEPNDFNIILSNNTVYENREKLTVVGEFQYIFQINKRTMNRNINDYTHNISHPYFDICGNVLVTKTILDYDEYQVHDILVHHKHNTNDLLSRINTYKIYVLEEPEPEQEPEQESEPEPEQESEPEHEPESEPEHKPESEHEPESEPEHEPESEPEHEPIIEPPYDIILSNNTIYEKLQSEYIIGNLTALSNYSNNFTFKLNNNNDKFIIQDNLLKSNITFDYDLHRQFVINISVID